MKNKLLKIAVIGVILSLIFSFPILGQAKDIEDVEVIWVDYGRFTHFKEGFAIVDKRIDDSYKYGVIDKTGKLIVPVEYDYIADFENGKAFAEKDGKVGYLDTKGNFEYTGYYVTREYEDLKIVKGDGAYKAYGVVDSQGQVIIPMQYDYIEGYSDGLICIEPDFYEDKFLYADKTGQIVMQINAQSCGKFIDGVAYIKRNDKYGLMDKNQNMVVDFIYDNMYELEKLGLLQVEKEGKQGYINRKGEVVVPIIYDEIRFFSEGLASAKKGDKYGFVDMTGKEVIPFIYEDADDFNEGLACVKKDGKYGFIDKEGNVIIPFEYNYSWWSGFSDGVVEVKKRIDDTDWTKGSINILIDNKGNILKELENGFFCKFEEGIGVFCEGDKYGCVDNEGNIVIPPVFDEIYNSSDGVIVVIDDNNRYGFIINPVIEK